MMAAIARKDYEQRRERQAPGHSEGQGSRKVPRPTGRQGAAQAGQGTPGSWARHQGYRTARQLLDYNRTAHP